MPASTDHECVNAAFAQVVEKLRKEQELSEDQFARSVGLHPLFYQGNVSDMCAPGLVYLLRIAAVLGRTPEELVRATQERLAALSSETKPGRTLPQR